MLRMLRTERHRYERGKAVTTPELAGIRTDSGEARLTVSNPL